MKSYGLVRFVSKPELKHTKDGTPLCEFVGVYNERRKVGDKLLEQAHFLDFVIWDKAAELVAEKFDKGSLIYIVSSTVRQDRWEDKDGNKRSRIIFRVDEFQFVPSQKAKEQEVNTQE